MKGYIVLAAAAFAATLASATALAMSVEKSYLSDDGKELGLTFDEQDGLSGWAEFALNPDATGSYRLLDILITNTSSAMPALQPTDPPSDIMLTSLYFDLGAPGLAAGDPMIVGGSAWVAAGSTMVGSAKKIETYDDLSAWWGYGNREYEEFAFLGPNIVSTRTAVADTFAAGGKLGGPDYGLASAKNGIADLYGPLPAVSDTIHVRLVLDQELGSLASIIAPENHIPYVEFGSNYAFIKDMPPLAPPAVPEPLTVAGLLVGAGTLLGYLRRRTRGDA